MNYEAWARLYDDLVRDEEDVPFFVELARQVGGARVAELMAGSGRVACHLAAAGVRLTCVDSSPAMLAVLECRLSESNLTATLIEQDVSVLDLQAEFALIYVAFNSFEELVTDKARRQTLASIYEHLAPEGRAVLTLHNPAAGPDGGQPTTERELTRSFDERMSGRPVKFRHTARRIEGIWTGTQSFVYQDTGETIASVPVHYRLIERTDFQALVSRAGFEVEALYGDYRLAPFVELESPQMIWTLRRCSS